MQRFIELFCSICLPVCCLQLSAQNEDRSMRNDPSTAENNKQENKYMPVRCWMKYYLQAIHFHFHFHYIKCSPFTFCVLAIEISMVLAQYLVAYDRLAIATIVKG